MEFKTDTQIELQKNANLARLHDVGMVSSDSEMYKAGWEDFKKMIYEPLRESQNTSTSDGLNGEAMSSAGITALT